MMTRSLRGAASDAAISVFRQRLLHGVYTELVEVLAMTP